MSDREREREALRRQLAAAEEAERRRLARELHDQLGQHLTAFTLGIDEARRLAGPDNPAQPRLAQLASLAQLMTRDARFLAWELRPPELDDVGLASALETYVDQWRSRFAIDVDFAVTGISGTEVPHEVATAVYRIAQEALTNVAKHAHARHVGVILDLPDGEVRLVVEDDGVGFDLESTRRRARAERRLGLAGMLERASLAGGACYVESTPGKGTTVYVRIPLDADRVALESG